MFLLCEEIIELVVKKMMRVIDVFEEWRGFQAINVKFLKRFEY